MCGDSAFIFITGCIGPCNAFCNEEYRINWVSLLNNEVVLIVEDWLESVADPNQDMLIQISKLFYLIQTDLKQSRWLYIKRVYFEKVYFLL